MKGDDIADNVFLLRCLQRDTCEELKPLSLAFMDVSHGVPRYAPFGC